MIKYYLKMIEERTKKNFIYLGLLIIISVTFIIIFNPFRKLPPDGVPNNYFDKIEQLSKLDVDIKIYGNITLSKKIPYKKINSLDYNAIKTEKTYRFLILDMKNIDVLTKADGEVISDLYYKSCYNIFIVGLDKVDKPKYEGLEELVKSDYQNEKFIMLRFFACGGPYHSNTLGDPYRNDNQKEYAVMDMILKTIRNIENSKRDLI